MIFNKNKKNYKFNSLNTYAWDRTVSGKKKFRRLFDRMELTYMGVELSFYNKLFDEKDWQVEIELIVNKIEGDSSNKISTGCMCFCLSI